MKKIEKVMKILWMFVMVLALVGITPVAAEEVKGSIKIENAKVGETYHAYQIFELESYDKVSGKYFYKINETSPWYAFVTKQGAGVDYVTVDEDGYVTLKEGVTNDETTAKAFAQAALDYLSAKNLTTSYSVTATSSSATIENLPLGYYLVDSTVGSLCGLTTTNPNPTIKDKNEEPTIKKEVLEDSNNSWRKTNDADIGQEIQFKTTITVKKGAKNYVLHDQMEYMDFIEVTSVQLDGQDVDSNNYEVITNNLNDQCTFEVKFDNEYCQTLEDDQEIVVFYKARLNSSAIIADTGNPNETWLTYGNNSETSHDKTHTFTWQIDIFKYTDANTPLAGATFSLSLDEKGYSLIHLTQVKGTQQYKVDTNGNVTTITTTNTGKFYIDGLNEGTYYLIENEAPQGYNKLNTPIKIVISHTENETGDINGYQVSANGQQTTEIGVKNKKGSLLPSTGGIGTTIFYILGSALMIGAAVLLILKKRAHH